MTRVPATSYGVGLETTSGRPVRWSSSTASSVSERTPWPTTTLRGRRIHVDLSNILPPPRRDGKTVCSRVLPGVTIVSPISSLQKRFDSYLNRDYHKQLLTSGIG